MLIWSDILSSSNWFYVRLDRFLVAAYRIHLLAQLPQYDPYVLFYLYIYLHPSIFRRKCDTVLNHTGLYEYQHGKMLMHLIFTFESLNVLNCPGECMRYYRQLRGITTRQLAEKLNIVPATVLGYEQGRFPIPYEITVATTKMLQIPESLLFDDYCVFIWAIYIRKTSKRIR